MAKENSDRQVRSLEFKVGPDDAKTFMHGVCANLGFLIKVTLGFVVLINVVPALPHITTGNTAAPDAAHVRLFGLYLSVIVALIFTVITLVRARRYAYHWFKLSDTGVEFFSKKKNDRVLKVIPYEQITAFLLNRNYLFSNRVNPRSSEILAWLRYRSSNDQLERLVLLGPKSRKEIASLKEELSKRVKGLQTIGFPTDFEKGSEI